MPSKGSVEQLLTSAALVSGGVLICRMMSTRTADCVPCCRAAMCLGIPNRACSLLQPVTDLMVSRPLVKLHHTSEEGILGRDRLDSTSPWTGCGLGTWINTKTSIQLTLVALSMGLTHQCSSRAAGFSKLP